MKGWGVWLGLGALVACQPTYEAARARHAAEYGCSIDDVVGEKVAPGTIRVKGCGKQALYICAANGLGEEVCSRDSEVVSAPSPAKKAPKVSKPKSVEAGAVTYDLPTEFTPGDVTGSYSDPEHSLFVRHEAAKYSGEPGQWIADNYPDASAVTKRIDDVDVVQFERAKKKTRVVGTALVAGGEVHVLWCSFDESDSKGRLRCRGIVATLRPTTPP